MNYVVITKQITKPHFKGILVNKLSTSTLAIKWLGKKLEILSANENESCTKNSLTVRGGKRVTKNLANL